jgi:phage-related protein
LPQPAKAPVAASAEKKTAHAMSAAHGEAAMTEAEPETTAAPGVPVKAAAGRAPAERPGTAVAQRARGPAAIGAEEPAAGAAAGKRGAGGRQVVLKMKEPPADISPASHKRIAAAQGAAGHAATAAAALPPASAHVDQARAAVTPPSAEAAAKAEADLVAALGERPKPSPEVEELCKQIYTIIASKTPDDEPSLIKTDPEAIARDAGNQLQGNVQGDVNRVDQSYSPLDQKPAGDPGQPGKPIEPPGAAAPTPPIDADKARPDPVPAQDASLDADAADTKTKAAQAGMDTEPAKLVRTGPVAEARDAQGELEQTAKEDPAKVMAQQQATLAKAGADMAALQKSAMDALAGSRHATVSDTGSQQHNMVGSEESMRTQASAQAQAIFTDAQNKVSALLQPLAPTAKAKWDAGVAISSSKFKQALKEVEDWLKERHGGGWGAVVSVWDDIAGLPFWVTDKYKAAESAFGNEICDTARQISIEVNGVIMACEAIIADARTRISSVFSSLPASLQSWAAGEQAKFGAQLDGLAQHAHEVQTNFTRDLVKSATQSFQDVRDQLHALREKAKGLVGRVVDAIDRFEKDPAKFILEGILEILGIPPSAFWAVVAKIQKAVKDIADDPMKFANNLMKAVGQGFSQFFDHILNHLLKGFIDWLTGGLASAGVTLPKDASVKSIVTFILQLMGITWPRIRKLLAKHIGEENVALIEKVYSIVANLIALGPEGVFEMIKEKLNPATILNQIIKAAVDYMIKAVIKAVSTRIILLFNPVGAILQALEAIYKVLKWIFVNAARIFRLVETIVNGIADIIAGSIGGLANAVESALGQLIAPVIDFLADYLGFGDLPDKVKDTIIELQAWVESLLDEVIGWLVAKGKELLKAIGLGGEDKEKGPKPGQIGKTVTWTAAGEVHRLWIVKEGAGVSIMTASQEKPVEKELDEYAKMAESAPEDKRALVQPLIAQARQILATVDKAADQLAEEAAKPDQGSQSAAGTGTKEQEVEGGEDQLAGLLSQIREALGLVDPEQVKRDVAARVDQLPPLFESEEQLRGSLSQIWNTFSPKGLKSLKLPPATGAQIEVTASEKKLLKFVEALHESGIGGCFAVIEINGKIVYEDIDVPLVVWNQGLGGLHVEHRLLPILFDELEKHVNPGEASWTRVKIIIRYSPCVDKCENIQFSIEKRVSQQYPGVRILWSFVKEYEGKNIAREAVERKQQQGMLIAKVGQFESIGFEKGE